MRSVNCIKQQVFNIKEFGDSINRISPIRIKKDSLVHNIIGRLKKMPGEVEYCTAFGELFNNAGVKLKQGKYIEEHINC